LSGRQPVLRATLPDSLGDKSFRIWYDPGNVFYYSDGKLDPEPDVLALKAIR
jgi:hypothetical protein